MIKYIAVEGTHNIRNDREWYTNWSPFTTFLKTQDCIPLITNPLWRFSWSTALDGLDRNNDVWDTAGRALAHYIAPPLNGSLVKPEDTFIIAHSHGGNVVAYACGKYGLKVNGLITVGTPIRNDLHDMYEMAAGNIQRHLHLHGGISDYMGMLGALFDGRFGIHRDHPYAQRSEKVPGGHGGILRDPDLFPEWLKQDRINFWKGDLDPGPPPAVIVIPTEPQGPN